MKVWHKNLLAVSTMFALSWLLAAGITEAGPRFSAHDATIRSMVFDQQGRMWVATFGRGLWLIDNTGIRRFYDEKLQQPYPMINNLLFTGQQLWVATAGGGCLSINTITDKIENTGQHAGFEKLHALTRTNAGQLLIGSVGSGTGYLKDGAWLPVKGTQPINLAWVNSIVEWQNRLWLGTSTGLYSNSTDLSEWRPQFEKLNRGINHLAVADDKLLIATTRHGLYSLSPGSEPQKIPGIEGQVYFILTSKSAPLILGEQKICKLEGASANSIETSVDFSKCAVTDVKNRFFIGTTDGKIYRSENGTEFELKYFFSDNGLEEQKQ